MALNAPPPPATGSVLLAKGQSVLAIDPKRGAADNKNAPLDANGFNSVIVDMVPDTGAASTTITLLGAPYQSGPWLQEVDPQAVQTGVTAQRRFVVTGISAFVAVQMTAPANWRVILTPFNAAAQTSLSVTATAASTIANGADVALGSITDAAVDTDANGTLNGHVRGLVKILASVLLSAAGALRVSLRGKGTTEGDTPVLVTAVGRIVGALGYGSAGYSALTAGATYVSDEAGNNKLLAQIPYVYNGTSADALKGDNTGAARVSAYGKGAAAGDTPLLLTTAGRVQIVTGGGFGAIDNQTNAYAGWTTTADTGVLCAGVYPFLFNGVGWDMPRAVTKLKTNQATALASGSDLTVWTPAASKKFRLRSLHARASIAGRYEVRDATGTVIADFYLAANVWTQVLVMEANGYLSAAANNALLIRNQSGSAADLDAAASGSED